MKSGLTSGRINEIMVAYWEKFQCEIYKGDWVEEFLKNVLRNYILNRVEMGPDCSRDTFKKGASVWTFHVCYVLSVLKCL